MRWKPTVSFIAPKKRHIQPERLQSGLLTYLNEYLPTIGDYENTAIAIYGGVSGESYVNDLELYKALTDTVIPNYRKLVEGLNGFLTKLKTNEVRELNAKYIEAAKTYLTGFLMLEKMLDNQDASKAGEINGILEKGQLPVGEWLAEFQGLCKENEVQIQ